MSSRPRAPDNGLKGERVVTRIHVPGRHKPFHGACGKRVLRFTPRPMNSRDHLVSWRDHHGQLVRNMWYTAGGAARRVRRAPVFHACRDCYEWVIPRTRAHALQGCRLIGTGQYANQSSFDHLAAYFHCHLWDAHAQCTCKRAKYGAPFELVD